MAWSEKYVTSSGGTGAGTEGDPWSLTHAAANVTAGTRVNVKAGTYSHGATDIDFTVAGTTAAPIWWRGYKTSIGDMDATPTTQRVDATDIPLFTSTTGRYYVQSTAISNYFSNISFTSGYASNATVLAYASGSGFHRCRFENTSTSTVARSCYVNALSIRFSRCWFRVPNTQPDCFRTSQNGTSLYNCIFSGGNNGIEAGSRVLFVAGCIFKNQAAAGIEITTGHLSLSGSTFYNSGTSCLSLTSSATGIYCMMAGNVFDTAGAYAIYNAGTTGTQYLISGNVYRDSSFTSGRLYGISESHEWDATTETSSPFVDAAGGDFTIKATANCYGLVRLFEKDGPTTYADVGAVQHQAAGGGAAGRRNMRGGFIN